MKSIRGFIPCALLGLAALASGCGSNGATAPDVPALAGAGIQGSVTTASGAAAGMHVTVTGTPLAATTDGAGRFTLSGVPSGTATLRFQGQDADARLAVPGLAEGQVISLAVRVSGSEAVIASRSDDPRPSPTPSPSATPSPGPTPSPENEVEFRGRIDSIGASSLVVSGRSVRTDGGTRIRRSGQAVSLSDLRVGQTAEVEGVALADGSVRATKISVEDDADGDDGDAQETEFRGTVQSVTPPSLRVDGRTVLTDSSTRITRRGRSISLADIHAGDRVEVEGKSRSGGGLLATKISLEG